MMPTVPRRQLKLYISASKETIGSLLAQDVDDDSVERAIYYQLSRVLNDAERIYNAI